jgi:hypothetical protein
MEISPMPPISEDCSSQGESEMGDEGDSNFEQLMVSMLEERDKVDINNTNNYKPEFHILASR